jgi:Flp pilus assembly protein TadG
MKKHFIARLYKQLNKNCRALWQQQDGANLVLMAFVIPVLIGFAGLAVDGSNIYYQSQRMQISADAAALGGARKLAASADEVDVNSEIHQLAIANGADAVTWTYINHNRGVHVVAEHAFPAYFARIYGHDTFTVTAGSEAQYEPVTGVDGLFPLTLDCKCVSQDDIIPVEDGSGGSSGTSATATPTTQPDYSVSPSAGTVQFADGQSSSYGITFLGQTGDTWTYQVDKISGIDLSYWLLGISTCTDKIVSFTPAGAAIGADAGTNATGIKWNEEGSFTSGTFAFTLDTR